MIVSGEADAEFHSFRIGVHPESYDGYPPIAELLIDARPHKLSPELIAASALLAFRPFCATLSLEEAVSPLFSQSAGAYMNDASFVVQPVTLKASSIFESGHKELVVVCPDLGCPAPRDLSSSQLALNIDDRTVSFGFSMTGSECRVATNAKSLGLFVASKKDRQAIALACAVLLAPSMGCRGICAVGGGDPDLTELVNATGLTMRYLEPNAAEQPEAGSE